MSREVCISAALVGVLSLSLLAQTPSLPASGDDAGARLHASSRHGEWVSVDAGHGDTVSAWLVYPERSDPAPVVVVIHEIFGLSDWIRGVADQLAAEGFIAIAPDLLSGKGPDGGGTESFDREGAVRAIRELDWAEVVLRLNASAKHTMALPAARSAFAVIGFCWGGSRSFRYATEQPNLRGAVVFYGSSPPEGYERVTAVVLGHYGGDDARVNATIERAEAAMQRLGKRYEYAIYDGAGHGFLRAQGGRDGANLEATRRAWPRTVEFLEEVLLDGRGR